MANEAAHQIPELSLYRPHSGLLRMVLGLLFWSIGMN